MALALSTTGWWVLGSVLAAAVVVVAALLLLAIIALAKRIERQAREITAALEGARRYTEPLFDIAALNHSLERTTRALAAVRTKEDAGIVERVTSALGLELGRRDATAENERG